MTNEFLLIEAGGPENDRPASTSKVIGVAYGGGPISLPGWKHPLVIDLAGLEVPETVPLLANHTNHTSARVGLVRARVVEHALEIEGEIVAATSLAEEIVRQARAGADWQLSLGAEVLASSLVPAGRSAAVNGRECEGPFFHVARARLREVSVVAVGADGGTRMQVTARFVLSGQPFAAGDATMSMPPDAPFHQWLAASGLDPAALPEAALAKLRLAHDAEARPPAPAPEPPSAAAQTALAPVAAAGALSAPLAPLPDPALAVRAERERIAGIQAICNGEYPDIEREAIRAEWTSEQAGQEVLRRIRAARPEPDPRVAAYAHAPKPDTAKTIEAALCLRSGIAGDDLVAHYGEAVVNAAHRDRQISLQEMFARCLRMEGQYFHAFDNDAIRAGFSTVSLPGILSNVANKRLLRAFESQPIVATRLCAEGDLANFNEAQRYRLTDIGDLEPVAADGRLKHGGMKEEQATNQVDTYGKAFTLSRKMIFNDDLNAFMKIPAGLGAKAARKIDQLFFQRLMRNPNGLFSDKHRNLLAGPDSTLTADSLAAATQLFLDQTDADGQSINIQPKFLLVPTGLRIAARELLNSVTFTAVGGADVKTRIPTYNALQDENLEVITSAFLSNKNYPGNSPKAWYLFGDPAVMDTFEIGYLKGMRTPTVEKTSVDFEELGMKFRVYFDLGVREQDHRGMVKAAGQ